MAPLADQVEVEVAERGQEAVRVADRERVVLVLDLELVVEGQLHALDGSLEDALASGGLQLGDAALRGADVHRLGVGPEGADHRASVPVRMGPEEGVRVRRAAGGEKLGCGHVGFLSDRGRRKHPDPLCDLRPKVPFVTYTAPAVA